MSEFVICSVWTDTQMSSEIIFDFFGQFPDLVVLRFNGGDCVSTVGLRETEFYRGCFRQKFDSFSAAYVLSI